MTEPGVRITKDGPYMVTGGVRLAKQTIVADAKGDSREWEQGDEYDVSETYLLCRCGHSGNKPFCDDTHLKIGFDGTEVASREPYLDQAGLIEGPADDLTDASALCSAARFCDPDGAIWRLIRRTGNPRIREAVERMGVRCPSGRLVVWDKASGRPLEPDLEPSIGLVEDSAAEVSGPIWVRGRIPVESSDGTQYEVRNRMTLCRCGASQNKPFCDGSHIDIGFRDDR
jgi:CDGSH-type Zn-finger protein